MIISAETFLFSHSRILKQGSFLQFSLSFTRIFDVSPDFLGVFFCFFGRNHQKVRENPGKA